MYVVLTDWQTVENVYECFPQFNAVFAFALVVEAVNSGKKDERRYDF